LEYSTLFNKKTEEAMEKFMIQHVAEELLREAIHELEGYEGH